MVVALATALAFPAAAGATADHIPTQWQLDAHTEPLLTAPPPAEKPVICIVDTGVTPTPDLDIVSRTALDGGTPDDVTARPGHYGHGTTVAHMAAAKVNGWGSSGTFPHARIASVRIFDDVDQRVPWRAYIRGLWQCAAVRPKPVVAVLAIGASTADALEEFDLTNAVRDARDRDRMSVVAAAGNSGGPVDMPARLPDVVGIASSDRFQNPCGFSARGAGADLAVVGCDLSQSGWDGSPWRLAGTSFSAPVAAGVLAAIRGYEPRATALEAEEILVGHPATTAGAAPALDASQALNRAHISLLNREVVAEEGDEVHDVPHGEPGQAIPGATAGRNSYAPAVSATPLRPASLLRTHRTLVRPRVTRARRDGAVIFVAIGNKSRDVLVEIRAERRRWVRRAARFRVRTTSRRLKLRFIQGSKRSAWTLLLIPTQAG